MHASIRPSARGLFGSAWQPNRTLLVYAILGALPYPPDAAAVAVGMWADAATAMQHSLADMKAAIDTYAASAKANDQYLSQAQAFYDGYVRNAGSSYAVIVRQATSVADMAYLKQGVADANQIFQRANAQISNLLAAKATSGMPTASDSSTSPTEAPAIGIFKKPSDSLTPASKGSSFVLPILAAAAAYFALK